jgi:hypothetical protein
MCWLHIVCALRLSFVQGLAALQTEQRLRDFSHGLGRITAVENDKVGGVTDRHAVMRGIRQPRRPR